MTFRKFVNRLLGGTETVAISDDPFGSKTLPSAVSPPPPREPGVMVQRDEILDGRSRIAGYRFVARRLVGGAPPAAAAAAAALRDENLSAFAARRLAIVPLATEDWGAADFRQFVAPHATFLPITPPHDGDRDNWIRTIEAIKTAGGRIALDGIGAADAKALALADLVVLDFSAYSLEAFERLVKSLAIARPQLALAADGIGSWAEHRLCQAAGVRYSLGGFAAAPDEDGKGEKLNQSRLVLIEMLNLLRREADLAEISAVAKRDPGVAVKVVAMANSPLSGLSGPVGSLEQAMLVLGREMLYRWLSLALFRAGAGGGRDEALLELALCRARFLELVASGSRPARECDELFLVGLLSLLDSLLGMPMAQVVARMNLPPAVADVLMKSEGPYGRFLMLALALEKGRVDRAAELAVELGIAAERLEEAGRSARAWAEEALQAS